MTEAPSQGDTLADTTDNPADRLPVGELDDGSTATYSPEDNKLRLYPAARLDADIYSRVKAAGFKWAPKQGLFVAPMWTPDRADLLAELCGYVGDEDKSLAERAEERADRFDGYRENRLDDANAARERVAQIADNIPLGQPILIGHHSEKHARRDAAKIENGMRKAVEMWECAEYWQGRARSAIRAAKYKERPDVRARRIRTLEAEARKQQREKAEAEKWLRLWSADGLTKERALALANHCWLSLPRKEGDRPDFHQCPSAYDALTNSHPSLYAPRELSEVIAAALATYPRLIARAARWLMHYENRLSYERAMLAEDGGTIADKKGPEAGGGVRCWCSPGHGRGFSYVVKVNKVSVTVRDSWSDSGSPAFSRNIPFDKLAGVISRAEVDQAKAAGRLHECRGGLGFFIDQAAETHAESNERAHVEAVAARAEEEKPAATPAEDFRAMKETLRQGVQVVTAPQLFPTPAEVADRMVALADIRDGHEILEPSAGTGALIDATRRAMAAGTAGRAAFMLAVEVNRSLAARLIAIEGLGPERVLCGDFLALAPTLRADFDRVLMNPPFADGADIKHTLAALALLKPGGLLVGICANGPRQADKLQPLADSWETLPAGTFAGTQTVAALFTIRKGAA